MQTIASRPLPQLPAHLGPLVPASQLIPSSPAPNRRTAFTLISSKATSGGWVTYSTPSTSEPGVEYLVQHNPFTGRTTCGCKGFIYSKHPFPTCKHCRAFEAQNAAWDAEFEAMRVPAQDAANIDACEFFGLPDDADADTIDAHIWAHRETQMELEELNAPPENPEIVWWESLRLGSGVCGGMH